MSEGTGGGTQEPDPYQDHDQIWGPVQEQDRPKRKSLASTNTWTVMTILSLLGPLSFSSLVFAFMDLRERSGDSGRSHALTKIAWVVFAVASVTGTVGFLVHVLFPF